MKLTLKEQDLRKIVGRGIMEVVDQVMTQRGAVAHFNEKSSTAEYIKRLEADTGWKFAGYTNDGSAHSFVMYPNSDSALPYEKFMRRATITFEDQATVEPFAKGGVKITFGLENNRDFQNSQKYAQAQWDSQKAWKTPWNLGGEQ